MKAAGRDLVRLIEIRTVMHVPISFRTVYVVFAHILDTGGGLRSRAALFLTDLYAPSILQRASDAVVGTRTVKRSLMTAPPEPSIGARPLVQSKRKAVMGVLIPRKKDQASPMHCSTCREVADIGGDQIADFHGEKFVVQWSKSISKSIHTSP